MLEFTEEQDYILLKMVRDVLYKSVYRAHYIILYNIYKNPKFYIVQSIHMWPLSQS